MGTVQHRDQKRRGLSWTPKKREHHLQDVGDKMHIYIFYAEGYILGEHFISSGIIFSSEVS